MTDGWTEIESHGAAGAHSNATSGFVLQTLAAAADAVAEAEADAYRRRSHSSHISACGSRWGEKTGASCVHIRTAVHLLRLSLRHRREGRKRREGEGPRRGRPGREAHAVPLAAARNARVVCAGRDPVRQRGEARDELPGAQRADRHAHERRAELRRHQTVDQERRACAQST